MSQTHTILMANSKGRLTKGSSQDLATVPPFQVKISIKTSTELSTFAQLQTELENEVRYSVNNAAKSYLVNRQPFHKTKKYLVNKISFSTVL